MLQLYWKEKQFSLLLQLKSWSARGASDHPAFMGNCTTIQGCKNMGSVQNFVLLFCVWCESRELGSRGSSRFSCVTPVVETFSDRVAFRIPPNISDGAPLQKQTTALTLISRCQAFSQSNQHLSLFPSVRCFAFFLPV